MLAGARSGAAALEFAIIALPFFAFLFAIIGAGLDGFYQLTFDEAVRNAARQVQIDAPAARSASAFASAVCSEFGGLAPNCTANLTYNLQSSATTSGFASMSPAAISANGTLPNGFLASGGNGDNVNVLVQAAYPLPFVIPFFAKLITGTHTSSIMASAAIRIEPF